MAFLSHAATQSWGEALSGISGSISLTAWICLLLPQLWTNFKAKSADGLSMPFLVIWTLGDAANLSGALLTRLAPSAVALAVYFCILDVTLISQCLYYKIANTRRLAQRGEAASADASEDSPLLTKQTSTVTHQDAPTPSLGQKSSCDEEPVVDSKPWTYNALSLLAVYAIGFAAWILFQMIGARRRESPEAPDSHGDANQLRALMGLMLGYASAALYLCARIPQIVKNYREKSCQGLSLLFFMLSLTGNLTYGVSLIAYSQSSEYLQRSVPWLLGSLGTMVEDATIFVQFRIYAAVVRLLISFAIFLTFPIPLVTNSERLGRHCICRHPPSALWNVTCLLFMGSTIQACIAVISAIVFAGRSGTGGKWRGGEGGFDVCTYRTVPRQAAESPRSESRPPAPREDRGVMW